MAQYPILRILALLFILSGRPVFNQTPSQLLWEVHKVQTKVCLCKFTKYKQKRYVCVSSQSTNKSVFM